MSAIQVKINKQVRHCVMVSFKKNNTFCLQRHLHAIKKKNTDSSATPAEKETYQRF